MKDCACKLVKNTYNYLMYCTSSNILKTEDKLECFFFIYCNNMQSLYLIWSHTKLLWKFHWIVESISKVEFMENVDSSLISIYIPEARSINPKFLAELQLESYMFYKEPSSIPIEEVLQPLGVEHLQFLPCFSWAV